MTRQQVIFVDDDDALRAATVQSLELADIEVRAFADAETALAAIDDAFSGAVVTDIRMPRLDGLEFFARIRAIDPEIPVILITGHADVPMAIGALKGGAFDFLAKPYATDHLIAAVRKALTARRLILDNRMLRAAAETSVDSPLIGDSPVMAQLRATIVQIARADIDVLVEGETGTGKELAALLLHRKGPRSGRPFVAVDCGALPEGLAEVELFGHDRGAPGYGPIAREGRIEQSHRGTLFLDGIDNMPLAIQSMLLRVVEERKIRPIGASEPRGEDPMSRLWWLRVAPTSLTQYWPTPSSTVTCSTTTRGSRPSMPSTTPAYCFAASDSLNEIPDSSPFARPEARRPAARSAPESAGWSSP